MQDRRTLLKRIGGTAGALAAGSATAANVAADESDDGSERLVVGMKPGASASSVAASAQNVHRELDFGEIGSAVVGDFPETAASSMAANSAVRYVEEDRRIQWIPGESSSTSASASSTDYENSQSVPWGVDRVDAEEAHDAGYQGAIGRRRMVDHAHVAIVDSGIKSDHPELESVLGEGKNFVESDQGSPEPWDDRTGHGTHCAGIVNAVHNSEGVVGTSTRATLHAARVLDQFGRGTYSAVAEGIQWAAEQGYEVASASLGGDRSELVKDACDYAYQNGTLVVAASGNDVPSPCLDRPNSNVGFPAAYDSVMAVGAMNENDERYADMCTGPEVEITAPGVDVPSSDIDPLYSEKTGTSMATPHVSSTAGMLMTELGLPNADRHGDYEDPGGTREVLRRTAEDIGLSSEEQGNGLLDTEGAVSLAGEVGTVEVDQPGPDTWHTVELDQRYVSPVVIVQSLSYNDPSASHVQVRNKTGTSFEFQIQEWGDQDGVHGTEEISYMVLREGTYTLTGGHMIEADTRSVDSTESTFEFRQDFGSAEPILFTNTVYPNTTGPADGDQAVVRQERTSDEFTVWLSEATQSDGDHGTEYFDYVAVHPGVGNNHGTSYFGNTVSDVSYGRRSQWHDVGFVQSFDDAEVFLADLQTATDDDACTVRYRNKDATGAEIRIQEDGYMYPYHSAETVGYLAFEYEDYLFAEEPVDVPTSLI